MCKFFSHSTGFYVDAFDKALQWLLWSYRDNKYRRGENKLKFLIIIILCIRPIADIREIFLMELVKPSGILEIENKEGI